MQQVQATKSHVQNFVDQVLRGLPAFIGAVIILIISFIIARALEAAVHKILTSIHLDQRLHTGHGGNFIQRAIPSPTNVISRIVFWVLFLFGLSIAVSVLGIPVLVDFVRAIYGYLPNVLAALIIFLVASALSAGIATTILKAMGDTPTGKAVASAGPAIIMGIAIFMILSQLRIAPQIVTITYAAITGSLALGTALAFGLGGRDVANKILQSAYEQGQRQKKTVAQDVSKGAQTAKGKANEARNKDQQQ